MQARAEVNVALSVPYCMNGRSVKSGSVKGIRVYACDVQFKAVQNVPLLFSLPLIRARGPFKSDHDSFDR